MPNKEADYRADFDLDHVALHVLEHVGEEVEEDGIDESVGHVGLGDDRFKVGKDVDYILHGGFVHD